MQRSIVCGAIHQHLRLDDRHQPRLLAQRGVARERVAFAHTQYSLGRSVADRVCGAPLGEPGPESAILLEPLAQPVEPLGDRLALRVGERLRALVDLDPRDDALRVEQLRERRPVRGSSGGSSRRTGLRR